MSLSRSVFELFGPEGKTLTSIFSRTAGDIDTKFLPHVELVNAYRTLGATGHISETLPCRGVQRVRVICNFLEKNEIEFN